MKQSRIGSWEWVWFMFLGGTFVIEQCVEEVVIGKRETGPRSQVYTVAPVSSNA